ncbi:hypothetical protein SAMN05880590_11012 [Rhizobium sp. RU35A]|uniref:hypothetical protein n=1 Tax=Rhizobium sp. RU35A TaxID=1907414 RepID=UPI0009545DC9|nr:hypothetical protein [Rhizobium sp. RU35A]SIQ98939.1 hypothetical protein SAMN05880590_11012 [Rhizobium sp. RU35A]
MNILCALEIHQSLADMAPGRTVADWAIRKTEMADLLTRRVPIAEIAGASIGYSFQNIERLRATVGSNWLAIVAEGLDLRDPDIIRPLVEIGAHGADADMILQAVPVEKLCDYIFLALIWRMK